jgi:hypothetical protein
MDKIIGVYKITSPKKRVYIGQSADVRRRFKEYKILHCKDQPRLYNSLKKHGVDKHKFEILHQCKLEQLNKLECYYIELFQCFNNEYGLNLKSGGDRVVFSEETKKKISDKLKGRQPTMLGRKHTEETKRKMSENSKGEKNHNYGKPSIKPMLGKKHSDETKRKMSENNKGEKHPMYGKTHSEEAKRKISENNRTKDIEVRKKMSEAHKGVKKSAETRQRMSDAKKQMTEETKKKISESNKGKIMSQEFRQKTSKRLMGNTFAKGSERSEEFRQKISESWKKRRCKNKNQLNQKYYELKNECEG